MDEVKPGDIIFTRPNGWLFDIIRRVTTGDYGHVCIVTHVIGNHAFITEAMPRGVDVNDFVWHTKANEEYIVYRNMELSEEKVNSLIVEAVSYHGKPYDISALINFIVGKTWFGTNKSVYCSEMIYRILLKFNLIKNTFNPEMISPADLRKLIIEDSRYQAIIRRYTPS